jgi:hypothetical protein
MAHKTVTFERSQGSFMVREQLEGSLEAHYRCSFEHGFRRMSELQSEGYREVSSSELIRRNQYIWEK